MNPILAHADQIVASVRDNPVTIVCAETGAGKTTDLPPILFKGFDLDGMIGVTEPRRLATTATTRYIAEQMGCDVGGLVGYKIRLDDQTSDDTKIKLLTDGMLLAEIENDPLLRKYSIIMIDEAHERSVNIDTIMGFLKKIQETRSDLRIVIASATIDLNQFTAYFADANVIEVSGRTFPVEVVWSKSDYFSENDLLEAAVAQAVQVHENMPPGDVLVFVSGVAEINQVIGDLQTELPDDEVVVLPAHGNLAAEDLQRILESYPAKRKIVVATNVAETSLTINGIVYVVDTGLVKVSSFNPKTGFERLAAVEHSQAGVKQRTGRAGRTQSGICFRLFSEDNFNLRAKQTAAEIQRISLDSLVLRLLSLGISDPREFDLIERPSHAAFNEAFVTLESLGAVNESGVLTSLGRKMSRLPLQPKLARMVLEAARLGCVEEVVTVAAFLSSRDVFLNPPQGDDRWKCRHTHGRRFKDNRSDATMYLRIWKEYEQYEFSREWCDWRYLSGRSMYEVKSIRSQLLRIVEQEVEISSNDSRLALKKAVAAGLIQNLLVNTKRSEYSGVFRRLQRVLIHPGSGLSRNNPLFVVCAEVMKTSRAFAKFVVEVELEWLPELAPSHFYFKSVRDESGIEDGARQVMLRTDGEYDVPCGTIYADGEAVAA